MGNTTAAQKLKNKYEKEFGWNSSPLVCSCQYGRFDDVKLLITGHDVNGSNNGNNMTLKEYVNHFGNDSKRGYEVTPLMAAAENEHFQIVQYLIEQCEADPNIANIIGWNALHLAARSNKKNTELIDLLLTHMSINSINKKNNGGDNPLDLAFLDNKSPIKQEIIDLIRSKGGKRVEVNERYKREFWQGTPLVCACQYGRFDDVKLLITGHNVNGSNGNNMTLEEYVNQVSENSEGDEITPLMAAAENEHFQIVQYLIEQCEADPNIFWGQNALHLAAGNNEKNTDVIQLLLNDMSINSINIKTEGGLSGGFTPLDCATYYNKSPIKQEIIDLIRSKGREANDEPLSTKKKKKKNVRDGGDNIVKMGGKGNDNALSTSNVNVAVVDNEAKFNALQKQMEALQANVLTKEENRMLKKKMDEEEEFLFKLTEKEIAEQKHLAAQLKKHMEALQVNVSTKEENRMLKKKMDEEEEDQRKQKEKEIAEQKHLAKLKKQMEALQATVSTKEENRMLKKKMDEEEEDQRKQKEKEIAEQKHLAKLKKEREEQQQQAKEKIKEQERIAQEELINIKQINNNTIHFTKQDKDSISQLINKSSIYATKEALENFTLLDGELSDHVLKLNQLIKNDNELNGYYSAFSLTLACKY